MIKEFDRWNMSKKTIDENSQLVENDILIWQTRSFDRKRLIRKIGMLSDSDFESLVALIGRLFPEKTKTPDGVFSEAEARGFDISVADEIGLSNESIIY